MKLVQQVFDIITQQQQVHLPSMEVLQQDIHTMYGTEHIGFG